MRTLESLPSVQGKTVIVRCDLNVPLDGDKIVDDGRIRAALPTLNKLAADGAKIVVISHLGRPAGAPEAKYSLAPVAKRMSELLGKDVVFVPETVGESAKEAVANLSEGDVLLLENLRFNPGEASKDEAERVAFAAQLAELADFAVSDGFGVVHRAQASVTELEKALPSAAGLLVEAEVKVLANLTENTERPYVVVLGGSKVSDKLGVIRNLLQHVDALLIGGGMAFTFLKAQGFDIASSLVEDDQLDTVREYLAIAKERGVKVLLPTDIVVAEKFAADAAFETVAADNIAGTAFGSSGLGLDIGPATAEAFAAEIKDAKTVFWNGPMGVYEMESFANGTKVVAQALADTDALSVVGGGDSAAAVRALGFADSDFSHISTGGGASLEFLEGKTLPGVEVLV